MRAVVEGLLFAAGEEGIKFDDLLSILAIEPEELQHYLAVLKENLRADQRGIQLVKIADRYLFTTLPEHYDYLTKLANLMTRPVLSRSAVETLAIVAYAQPVSKLNIEHLRGVRSERMLQSLERKGLISSHSSKSGTVYRTSKTFLDHFGLNSIADLPPAKEGV